MNGLTCCGTNRNLCGFYQNLRSGCRESKGMVFHAEEGKACPIYECSVSQKKLDNCSKCDALPCSIWKNTRDSRMNDEEFEESIRERIFNLNQK